MLDSFFDLPEENQIQYQIDKMKASEYQDGTRVYPDGTLFHAFVKNHITGVINTRIVKIE